MNRLADQVVIVTGAGSGIGEATALLCAEEGARVAAADRDGLAAGRVAAAIGAQGGTALPVRADVGDQDSVEAMVESVLAQFGQVDALVNNAGIARRHRVTEQDPAGWDEVMRVNVRGAFLCARAVLPHLFDRGGSIVNMASVVGVTGVPNRAVYSTSKGAIVLLTKNMALDYARYGIRVNCVCPGFTRTGMTKGLFANPESERKITALHPLGRLGMPEDIAKAVVFLLSSDASWITGQALAVDGGFTIGHNVDF